MEVHRRYPLAIDLREDLAMGMVTQYTVAVSSYGASIAEPTYAELAVLDGDTQTHRLVA